MKVPSVLSYIKAIEVTEGVITNKLESNIVTNVGVQSFVKGEDSEKEDKQNNIISSEKVYLSEEENVLSVKYGLTFTGLCSSPDKINNITYKKDLEVLAEEITHKSILTKMYARGLLYMILTGLYAERNRNNSSEIHTKIKFKKVDNGVVTEGEYAFKTNAANIRSYPYDREIFDRMIDLDYSEKCLDIHGIEEEDLEMFNQISDLIAESFIKNRSDNYLLNIEVENEFKLTNGAPIYPSELFVESKGAMSKIIKKRDYDYVLTDGVNKVRLFYKTLSTNSKNFGYTPEKISNALRRFDMWYDKDFVGPITFEPQGNSIKYAENFRSTKKDIVHLLDKHLEGKEKLSLDEEFFILAMFIRGGLFNSESKKKKEEK